MRQLWILGLGLLCFACSAHTHDGQSTHHEAHTHHHEDKDHEHHEHDHEKHAATHDHHHDHSDHHHDHDHSDADTPHEHHSIGDGPGADVVVNEKVLVASKVKWEQLNPARGDKSPQAGTLWGSRTGNGAAGFLLKPIDGFRSPPHIHNVAYRGVVISGLLHNDDPKAADMWMSTGSFWTQPAGEVHITAAKGDDVVAYIEVEDWFGVQAPEGAFDDGDRPVNVMASNLVWLDASQIKWISPKGDASNGAKITYLWGKPVEGKLHGSLMKFPASKLVQLKPGGKEFRLVVIKGTIKYDSPDGPIDLAPGSYLRADQSEIVKLTSAADADAVVYIRSNGHFETVK